MDTSSKSSSRLSCLRWILRAVIILLIPIGLCSFGIPLLDYANGCPIPLRQALRAIGYKIVFVSDRDGNNEIYIMDADGSNQINLTQNPTNDHYPAVSPNGKQIAFSSNRTGKYQIFVMNIDGSGLTNLSRSTTDDWDNWPTYRKPLLWTMDGRQVIFASHDRQFYKMDANGANRQRVRSFTDTFPEPSPDGSHVAFFEDDTEATGSSGPVLFVTDSNGVNKHKITDPMQFGWSFNWSPDSQKLAYVAGSGIAVSDFNGSNTRIVFDGRSSAAGTPSWSHKGEYLVFNYYPIAGRVMRDATHEHPKVYVVPADGSSNPCLLTQQDTYGDTNPVWIP